MYAMYQNLWLMLEKFINDYVFVAESSGKSGAEKKAEVVSAVMAAIDSIATVLKVPSIFITIANAALPFLIDAFVSRLNAEGIFKHSDTSTPAATATTPSAAANPTA